MDKRKSPTLVDVAKVAGVSKSVVSRVISGRGSVAPETKERVNAAIESLGYSINTAARQLSTGKSQMVGVLLRNVQSYFYSTLFSNLQTCATLDNYFVIGATGNMVQGSENAALNTLLSTQIDGIIIGSGIMPAQNILPVTNRIPTVVVSRPVAGISCSAVYEDPRQTASLAFQEIMKIGHKTILMAAKSSSYSSQIRETELRRIANENGLRMFTVEAGYDHSDGISIAKAWLANPVSTVILTMSYDCAASAIDYLAQHGISVPGDVSIYCLDANHLKDPNLPQISGLASKPEEYAKIVWSEMMRLLRSKNPQPQDCLVPMYTRPGSTMGKPTD